MVIDCPCLVSFFARFPLMPDDATCVRGDAKAREVKMTNQHRLIPYRTIRAGNFQFRCSLLTMYIPLRMMRRWKNHHLLLALEVGNINGIATLSGTL